MMLRENRSFIFVPAGRTPFEVWRLAFRYGSGQPSLLDQKSCSFECSPSKRLCKMALAVESCLIRFLRRPQGEDQIVVFLKALTDGYKPAK
jgi:hypothetical protein